MCVPKGHECFFFFFFRFRSFSPYFTFFSVPFSFYLSSTISIQSKTPGTSGTVNTVECSPWGMSMDIVEIRSSGDLGHAFLIRQDVFIREQGIPHEEEFDGLDDGAVHYLALTHGKPAGTMRIVREGSDMIIQRLAVLSGFRNTGIGSALLEHALGLARETGAGSVIIHAQVSRRTFYGRFGFREEGQVFRDCGIPHIRMVWIPG